MGCRLPLLAFVAQDIRTKVPRLWVANIDGTNIHPVNDPTVPPVDSVVFISSPAWSPDGNHIAYVFSGQIRVVDLRTSSDQLLVASASKPTWAPDSQAIAYLSKYQIWVINVDGSNPHPITEASQPVYRDLMWSPNGIYIAFINGKGELYTMMADGSNPTLVSWYMVRVTWEKAG
jgi:Tol biopolymer transport system component